MRPVMQTDYWKVVPAALALAGVMVFIFASFGPPASSSGFVTTLKGVLEPVAGGYVDSHQHYRMMPGVGSWLMGAPGRWLYPRAVPIRVDAARDQRPLFRCGHFRRSDADGIPGLPAKQGSLR